MNSGLYNKLCFLSYLRPVALLTLQPTFSTHFHSSKHYLLETKPYHINTTSLQIWNCHNETPRIQVKLMPRQRCTKRNTFLSSINLVSSCHLSWRSSRFEIRSQSDLSSGFNIHLLPSRWIHATFLYMPQVQFRYHPDVTKVKYN